MKSNIVEGLKGLAVPISKLKSDPKNARVHPDRNVSAIRESLERFGQRRPLVVNSITGIVEAGNGVLEAAKELGWDEIAVLYVDDDPATATGYALADNRTQETSFFDQDILQDLIGQLEQADPDLIIGWSPTELDEIMGRLDGGLDGGLGAGASGDDDQEGDEGGGDDGKQEPTVKTVTLYIPAESYETFLQDVERLAKSYETDDISATLIRAVEVWSKGGGGDE